MEISSPNRVGKVAPRTASFLGFYWECKLEANIKNIIVAAYEQSHCVVDSVLLDARNTLKFYDKCVNLRLFELIAFWKMETRKFSDNGAIGSREHQEKADDETVDAVTFPLENREACRLRCDASIVVPHVLRYYHNGASDRSARSFPFDIAPR